MPQERIYTPGDAIGPFKVMRRLGIGAVGIVYEAVPDPVQRDYLISLGIKRVAIKVARLDAEDRGEEARRQLVERLYREYRTLQALTNPGTPHLPEVYELGWHDGLPFLVMELISGPSLEDLLAQQFPMQLLLEIFLDLCGAVAILHDRGTVHRDIKPSNVVLRRGEPVLLDFSHCLSPAGRRLTGARELIGTPPYMSPEAVGHALRRRSRRPYLHTAADDVWGLGVLLYEILTGQAPWQTPPERRKALVREMLRGPRRHPSDLNPQVPRELGDAALMLLHPTPGQRPHNARAVAELLKPVVRKTSVTGRVSSRLGSRSPPANADSGARKPMVRHPGWGRGRKVLGLAAALLLVVGGGVAGQRGLESMLRALGNALFAVATPNGAKASLPQALPMPSEPLPGQMRAPCPTKYVEAIGGCWSEIQALTPEGKPAPCPDGIDSIREMKGKDGRVHCFAAVMDHKPTPNTEVPEQGQH